MTWLEYSPILPWWYQAWGSRTGSEKLPCWDRHPARIESLRVCVSHGGTSTPLAAQVVRRGDSGCGALGGRSAGPVSLYAGIVKMMTESGLARELAQFLCRRIQPAPFQYWLGFTRPLSAVRTVRWRENG